MKQLLLLMPVFWCVSAFGQKHTLKVTAEVVDEAGQPLVGAIVSTSLYSKPESGWGGGDRAVVKGVTDESGRCTLEGRTIWKPSVGYIVKKEGYYGGADGL